MAALKVLYQWLLKPDALERHKDNEITWNGGLKRSVYLRISVQKTETEYESANSNRRSMPQ